MQCVVVVSRCVDTLDSRRRLSSMQTTQQLHRVERCIRVLERVSYFSSTLTYLLWSLLSSRSVRVPLLS